MEVYDQIYCSIVPNLLYISTLRLSQTTPRYSQPSLNIYVRTLKNELILGLNQNYFPKNCSQQRSDMWVDKIYCYQQWIDMTLDNLIIMDDGFTCLWVWEVIGHLADHFCTNTIYFLWKCSFPAEKCRCNVINQFILIPIILRTKLPQIWNNFIVL